VNGGARLKLDCDEVHAPVMRDEPLGEGDAEDAGASTGVEDPDWAIDPERAHELRHERSDRRAREVLAPLLLEIVRRRCPALLGDPRCRREQRAG
jgi:hypothetical protein